MYCCWPDEGAVLDAGASIIGTLLEADCGRDCDTVGDRVDAIGCLDARSLALSPFSPPLSRIQVSGTRPPTIAKRQGSREDEFAAENRARLFLHKTKSARNASRASSLVRCSIDRLRHADVGIRASVCSRGPPVGRDQPVNSSRDAPRRTEGSERSAGQRSSRRSPPSSFEAGGPPDDAGVSRTSAAEFVGQRLVLVPFAPTGSAAVSCGASGQRDEHSRQRGRGLGGGACASGGFRAVSVRRLLSACGRVAVQRVGFGGGGGRQRPRRRYG